MRNFVGIYNVVKGVIIVYYFNSVTIRKSTKYKE